MHIPNEIIVTILVAIFGSSGFWLLVQRFIESKSASRKMLLGLGFERLKRECEKYIEQGWIEIQDFEELTKYLYIPYRDLGGNGTGEMLYMKVKGLPNESKVSEKKE